MTELGRAADAVGIGTPQPGLVGHAQPPSTARMRILLHDFAGHPFQAQLSRSLADRGHTVTHAYCGNVLTGRGRLNREATDPASLSFAPIAVAHEFARYSLWKRPLHELRYGRELSHLAATFTPDVVISANTPLLAQTVLRRHAQQSGATFVYWLQDLLGIGTSTQLHQRFGKVGGFVGDRLRSLESHLLRRSDAVVTITRDFFPLLTQLGVEPQRVTTLENWAPLDELPVLPRENAWAEAHGLTGLPVFLYAGTLGLKHDPALLLELAEAVAEDAKVVVVSSGIGADWLREHAARRRLDNLEVLPFQPYGRLPEVLATGDVLVTLLEPEAGVFSVPSKVLSYHCAGRAILCAVPPENLAARIVERNRSGLTVAPGDSRAFVAAGRRLLRDDKSRRELGRNARRYAEETFDITTIADRFEAVIQNARTRRATPRPSPPA